MEHTIQRFKVYNSVIFHIFTDLCNHQKILEHFCHSKKKPVTPFPGPLGQPLICFLSLWSCLLGTFCVMGSYTIWPLVTGFFHSASSFQDLSMLHFGFWLLGITQL